MGNSANDWRSSHWSSNAIFLVAGSLVALLVLGFLLFRGATGRTVTVAGDGASQQPPDASAPANDTTAAPPLVVYCAAGVKSPVEAIAKAFEQESFGRPIQLQFGGSGTLLSNLQIAKRGDLFVAADNSYIDLAREQDLIGEVVAVARQTPVIAVAKGNPKHIASVDDLARSDVRLALANPEAASIGQLAKKLLEVTGQWEKVAANAKVFKPTVSDVANDVMLGTVDAAILWDANVRQFPEKLEAVDVPDWQNHPQDVTAGVLKFSEQPEAALRFAHYMRDPAKGGKEFLSRGYAPVAAAVTTEAVSP